ncbi:hypothetical protein [Hoeflea sp.]|uniref:hypothetical protein n=1 Tax=Hoeflea sp. TaxID=1940281 RepID=UPI00374785DA
MRDSVKSPAPVPDDRIVQALAARNAIKPVGRTFDVAIAETNTGSQDNWEKF